MRKVVNLLTNEKVSGTIVVDSIRSIRYIGGELDG
ncbi:hypothetical protein [Staphylococcus phage vB_SsapH-Golestan101-M]|nr:hypothetical protein [Staphylococcus phage vB_SsapH-Golestan101-M]